MTVHLIDDLTAYTARMPKDAEQRRLVQHGAGNEAAPPTALR